MPIFMSEYDEKYAILQVAKLMVVSARTAPKSGGRDDILIAVVTRAEKMLLATEMIKIGEERNASYFIDNADSVRDSEALVLIGVRGTRSFGLNCGACGYASCDDFNKTIKKKTGQDFSGANCNFKVLDLGIALGSAVKTASLLNTDNRIMYTIGTAAKKLKMLPEASIIMGIPLSAKGKNIYVDRES